MTSAYLSKAMRVDSFQRLALAQVLELGLGLEPELELELELG